MRRLFLLSLSVLAVTAASAQSRFDKVLFSNTKVSNVPAMRSADRPQLQKQRIFAGASQTSLMQMGKEMSNSDLMIKRRNGVMRKTLEDGFYCTVPLGVNFFNVDEQGIGYGIDFLCVPGFTYENMFLNQSKQAVTWSINTTDEAGQSVAYPLDEVDEQGNLNYGVINKQSYYLMPTMTSSDGKKTYTFLEDGTYSQYYNRTPYIAVDTLMAHGMYPEYSGNSALYGYINSANGSSYLIGSGTTADEDDAGNPITITSIGFQQTFPKPVSPMYVQNVFFNAYADTDVPLPQNATLTMSIFNSDTDEMTAQLTCTADDISNMTDITEYYGTAITNGWVVGKYYNFTMNFSKTTVDEMGQPAIEPVVIDYPFYIVVAGLDQEGVNFNLGGVIVPEIYAEDVCVTNVFSVPGSEEPVLYGYRDNIAADVKFNSLFDYVDLWDAFAVTDPTSGENTVLPNANQLNVSADGQTIENASGYKLSDGSALDAVIFEATFPFYDADGNTNYGYTVKTSEEDDSWFLLYAEDGEDYSFLAVECDPLPTGTAGRWAKVYLEGRGYNASVPLIIKQGEIDVPSDLIRGDIKGDGVVNTGDVTTLYNVIFGTDTTTDQSVCDLDNDGNVNTGDVTTLYNIIFGTAE
ncbi:MAG: dockerin type I repeat-containing protein [Prevotella sp.]|nr:dockerin type I repeat-containing protein [Prevotella sp.]